MFFFEATAVSRNDASVLLVAFHYNNNVVARRGRLILRMLTAFIQHVP
jgi:hypothetical protein